MKNIAVAVLMIGLFFAVAGPISGEYFLATSTNATSTFNDGIDLINHSRFQKIPILETGYSFKH